MRAFLFFFAIPAWIGTAQSDVALDKGADTRVERAKGYHIVKNPSRTGGTPEEVKREKAEDDARRRRNTDITDQTAPTREPELKPKQITP